jgi:3-deoxy-D-manno-octulosonate 8-phosphate phosphatase (KDO 8-P phosphatase)
MAAKIKLLLLDVDGVMTDGSIVMDGEGKETKTFNVKDGMGLRLLMAQGIEVAIISGRSSGAVGHRAKDLGIETVYQGASDKKAICRKLMGEKGLGPEQVCAMGDDLADLPMLGEAGLGIAVADAAREVREAADFITKSRGGSGAVREACELLLRSQGKWEPALSRFQGK